MTFLNRRLFDNVVSFVDAISGANAVSVDVTKPNGVITLAISGNLGGDNIKIGSGSPEGSVSGRVGDLYQRTDGGTGTTLYTKETGLSNTGWAPVLTTSPSLSGYTLRTETAAVSAGLQLTKSATTTVAAVSAGLQLTKASVTTVAAISAGLHLNKAAVSTVAAISAGLQDIKTSVVTTADISAGLYARIQAISGATYIISGGLESIVAGPGITINNTNPANPIVGASSVEPWAKLTTSYSAFTSAGSGTIIEIPIFTVPAGQFLIQCVNCIKTQFTGPGISSTSIMVESDINAQDDVWNIGNIDITNNNIETFRVGALVISQVFSDVNPRTLYYRLNGNSANLSNLNAGIIDLYYKISNLP
jgi:hypothetical protein